MKESNVILISKRGAMKYANQSVYWESCQDSWQCSRECPKKLRKYLIKGRPRRGNIISGIRRE